jgi:transcriptional regulator with XRE-family HTH domain
MGEEDRLYGMSSDSTIEIEAADPTYAVKVGSRLRAIRKQKRLSLQEVEASSGQEFKASVLGAYERGERAISVPRLQRLARFYNVPVDQLLPRDDADLGPDSVIDLERGAVLAARSTDEGPVTIDLVRLEGLGTPEAQVLGRYLGMIQVQRGDFNGRMLTVRRDDLRAIACLLDASPDQARQRLDELRLRLDT